MDVEGLSKDLSAIEKSYRETIKDRALKKLGTELKAIEVMMNGRKMYRLEPVPPHHREAYGTEFEKEYKAGLSLGQCITL